MMVRYAMVISFFVAIMTTALAFDYYHLYRKEQIHNTKKEGQKIALALQDKGVILEEILRFIGDKIPSDSDVNKIATLLSSHPKLFNKDSIVWHVIHFINKDGVILANSLKGKQPPYKLQEYQIKSLQEADKNPWHLHYMPAHLSRVKRQVVLPTALAITKTDSQEVIGYLSVSIYIEQLIENLRSFTKENIGFVIMHKNGEVIASSHPVFIAHAKTLNLSEKLVNIETTKHFNPPFIMDDFHFHHVMPVGRLPMILLVGHNQTLFYQAMKKDLLPRLTLYVITIFLLFLGIFIVAYRLLQPILKLNHIATAISTGKKHKSYRSNIIEFDNLSKQIDNISHITSALRSQKNLLSRANNDLKNANTFIKSNMSFLSHELINPIATIIGFCDLLKNNKVSNPDEYIKIIHDVAHYQYKQLNYFLRLFQFQETKRSIERKEIDVKQLIEWNIAMLKKQADDNMVAIKLSVPDNMRIMVDEIMIGQVVQNMVSNGVKYNIPGGMLEIHAYTEKSDIIFEFKDDGIGISQNDIQKLFKRFSRLDQSHSIGYGVGLAYVKQCVDAHEGSIEVFSQPNQGTTFKVRLPNAVIMNKPDAAEYYSINKIAS